LGYLLTPVVAGLASVVGVYFQRASLGLRRRMKDSAVPGWLIPVFGALITWALGAAVFAQTRRLGVFSLGYDALLSQDGHQLEHVRPPRGLQGWQQLPVSAIANFRPVVVGALDAAEIRKVLKTHPYQRFPVVKEGKLTDILTRKEAEAAPAEKRAPRLETATTCLPGQTIRQLQVLLIESTTHLVVLTGAEGQAVLGVVTLHDLLRAEVEKAKTSEE
jgi:CIC family chloride channel protein